MGKHKKEEEAVASSEGAKDSGSDRSAPLSDLIRELRELGDRLGVELHTEFISMDEVAELAAEAKGKKRRDAPDDLWGAEEHLAGAPRIANILVDASVVNNPIQVLVNSQPPVYGRVLAVNDEVVALEVWESECTKSFPAGKTLTQTLKRPTAPSIAYIDIVAIDAVVTVPGELVPDEDFTLAQGCIRKGDA